MLLQRSYTSAILRFSSTLVHRCRTTLLGKAVHPTYYRLLSRYILPLIQKKISVILCFVILVVEEIGVIAVKVVSSALLGTLSSPAVLSSATTLREHQRFFIVTR